MALNRWTCRFDVEEHRTILKCCNGTNEGKAHRFACRGVFRSTTLSNDLHWDQRLFGGFGDALSDSSNSALTDDHPYLSI
jgi:hypothetical protein